jgi:hypothetical protein
MSTIRTREIAKRASIWTYSQAIATPSDPPSSVMLDRTGNQPPTNKVVVNTKSNVMMQSVVIAVILNRQCCKYTTKVRPTDRGFAICLAMTEGWLVSLEILSAVVTANACASDGQIDDRMAIIMLNQLHRCNAVSSVRYTALIDQRHLCWLQYCVLEGH